MCLQCPLFGQQADRHFISSRSSTLDGKNIEIQTICRYLGSITILKDVSIPRPYNDTVLSIVSCGYALQIVEFSISSSKPHVIGIGISSIVLTRSKRNALAIIAQSTLNPSLGLIVTNTLDIDVFTVNANLQSLLRRILILAIIEGTSEEPVFSYQSSRRSYTGINRCCETKYGSHPVSVEAINCRRLTLGNIFIASNCTSLGINGKGIVCKPCTSIVHTIQVLTITDILSTGNGNHVISKSSLYPAFLLPIGQALDINISTNESDVDILHLFGVVCPTTACVNSQLTVNGVIRSNRCAIGQCDLLRHNLHSRIVRIKQLRGLQRDVVNIQSEHVCAVKVTDCHITLCTCIAAQVDSVLIPSTLYTTRASEHTSSFTKVGRRSQ